MQRPITSTPNTEEHAPGLYRRRVIYAPFVWMTVMVIRLGIRAGIFPSDFLMASRPKIEPSVNHRNRQLRRARASCLRRAHRCMRKHGTLNPEDYTPKAYAHFAYVNMMPKHYTMGQFMEAYIRDNDLSRVQVYGLDAAHCISGFIGSLGPQISSLICSLLDIPFSGRDALSDPAPP